MEMHVFHINCIEECERLLQQHERKLRLQELWARELELDRWSQVLQLQASAMATAPATVTTQAIAAAPARASPLYYNRRDLQAMSTAPSSRALLWKVAVVRI